jgi:hypothetical protein
MRYGSGRCAMIAAFCQAPALDADKRARLCGEPATTERDVPTGYGDETVALAFCARHAAELDAEKGGAS